VLLPRTEAEGGGRRHDQGPWNDIRIIRETTSERQLIKS